MVVQLQRGVGAVSSEPGHVIAAVVDAVPWLVHRLDAFTHVVTRRQHAAVLRRTITHRCKTRSSAIAE